LALDQFKNLILPVMKMSRRPEAGRSAIVKNGELPPLSAGPIRMRDCSPQDVRDTMPDDAALSIETGRTAETPEEQLGVIPLFRSGLGMRAVTVAH
jgi:hypothetical protein